MWLLVLVILFSALSPSVLKRLTICEHSVVQIIVAKAVIEQVLYTALLIRAHLKSNSGMYEVMEFWKGGVRGTRGVQTDFTK
ncbi:uncharacterized protein PHALS_13992 [Plasmopara halstedii]|uniref:RxLR-like protein n=1 Tax=Plasmopara halstedii TaxID=4781 RepID=A0A0P1AR43_PLAHL|nr:uncharacterized protein PHALS_13992 [Plasmopara halstedii]CEG43698.1 hypothetical protein PHALS_13992 [Plasmopara halstedii]|eukprot:XP_024580067.1 hypothetical protein PHALS_13992 [Plasmopara halstedii]